MFFFVKISTIHVVVFEHLERIDRFASYGGFLHPWPGANVSMNSASIGMYIRCAHTQGCHAALDSHDLTTRAKK